jgi:RNA recognition motif-containing protein
MLDEAKRKALKEEQRRRRAIGRRAAATAKRAGGDVKEAKKLAAKEEQKSKKKSKNKQPKSSKGRKITGEPRVDKDVEELDDELARLEAELAGLDTAEITQSAQSEKRSAQGKQGKKETRREAKKADKVDSDSTQPLEEPQSSEVTTRRKQKRSAREEVADVVQSSEKLPSEDVDPAEAKRRRKEEKRLAKASAREDGSTVNHDSGKSKHSQKVQRGAPEASESKSADATNLYRLFVGGIAWHIDTDTLKRDFEECGTVSDCKILFGDDGRSRGIAFITMADKAGYDAAMKYDGEIYAGRKLNISARDDSHGKGRQPTRSPKGGGKGVGERPPGCKSIVVKGLSYAVTSDDLYECFASCGGAGPVNVNLLTESDTGKSRGVAFVDFSSEKAVDDAAKLSETVLKGRAFFIRYSDRC